MANPALVHVSAVNQPCDIPNCKKQHCPIQVCNRHTCPVCGQHYYVLIYSGNPQGCCTNCYKESTGDTQPWKGPVEVYNL